MKSKRGFARLTVLLIVLAVALVGAGVSAMLLAKNPISQSGVACTMEAKICPDGSSVGRSGPNCEFAACPQVEPATNIPPTDTTGSTLSPSHEGPQTISVPGMSQYTDADFGFSFWYPSTWSVRAEYSGDVFIGMPSTKRWVIYDANQKQKMQIKEFTFTESILRTSVAGCNTTLSYEDGWKETHEGCGSPSRIIPYNTALNTIGGLPTLFFQPDSNIIKYVVPLTSGKPTHGLVLDNGVELFNLMPLARTISPTDTSVAIPMSAAMQRETILDEQELYVK